MLKYVLISLVLVICNTAYAETPVCNKDIANKCVQNCTQAQGGKKIADDEYSQCFNACMSTCKQPAKKQ